MKIKLILSLFLTAFATACNDTASNDMGANQGVASPITAATPEATPESSPTASPSSTPARALYQSCKEILAANPTSSSGAYTIALGQTGTTTEVICDMESDGGGWTVLIDGANADRASLSRYFDHADAENVPDDHFLRDPEKGIFWEANQYFVAKNMPDSTEIRLVFNLSYNDPTYGSHCYAIMGLLSPTGYSPLDPTSFTAFVQKNDDSQYVKATYNELNLAEFQSVKVDGVATYPYGLVNGSRVFAGNPYGFGNTCPTFFFKRVMVR